MLSNNEIHFIMTGGTLDSYYDPVKATAIPNRNSYLPRFIPLLQLYEKAKFTQVFMKDSRDITAADRKKVLQAIKQSNSRRLIVIHGSYTVADTAKYIQQNWKQNDKVIIFVCSLIPLEGFAPTDAGFNLGYAVAKSQDLKKGIYVCMNGKVFNPQEVVKILKTGRFASIYTK